MGREWFSVPTLPDILPTPTKRSLVAPTPVICRTFLDKARIIKMLGEGGYGSVHLMSRKNGKSYAVKRIGQEGDPSVNCRETGITTSALREMDFLTRFQPCPYIVRLLGVCVRPHDVCIVMPPMPDTLVTFSQRLSDAERHTLASSLLHALLYTASILESFGMAHFDIKPQNVLVETIDNDVYYRIADFGLARPIIDDKEWRDVYTPSYMPPEVIVRGHASGKKYNADVWSIGVTMVEWCTGEYLFYSSTLQHLLEEMRPADVPFDIFVNAIDRDEMSGGLLQTFNIDDIPVLDALESMLAYSPRKRLSATKTLRNYFHETPNLSLYIPTETSRVVDRKGVRRILQMHAMCAMPLHAIELYTRYTSLGGDASVCTAVACAWLSEKYISDTPCELCDLLFEHPFQCSPRSVVDAENDVLATIGYRIYNINLTPVVARADSSSLFEIDYSRPLTEWCL